MNNILTSGNRIYLLIPIQAVCWRKFDSNATISSISYNNPALLCWKRYIENQKNGKSDRTHINNYWEAVPGIVASKDLHVSARRVIGEVQKGERAKGQYLSMAKIGSEQLGKKDISVRLSPSAYARMGVDRDSIDLKLTLKKPFLYRFDTEENILCLDFELTISNGSREVSAAVLSEVVYLLSHNSSSSNDALSLSLEGEVQKFSIADLASSLITSTGMVREDEINQKEWTRFFSYVAVSVDKKDSLNDELAYRLAKRYTSSYSIEPLRIKPAIFKPFSTVTHCCTLEGGSLIVDTSDQIEVLENLLANPVPHVYLPIALMSYHEFTLLLKLSQEKSGAINERRLDEQREKLFVYRTKYRFSYLSLLEHHNDVYLLWKKSFGVEKLLDDVTADVDLTEKELSSRTKKKFIIFSSLVSAFGAAMIIKEVVELVKAVRTWNMYEWQLKTFTEYPGIENPEEKKQLLEELNHQAKTVAGWEFWTLVLYIIGVVLAFIIAWRWGTKLKSAE